MRALVTGAAGFIGSHLTERLVASGASVVAVDAFTPYYDETQKRDNASAFVGVDAVTFVEDDLRTCELEPLLDGVDVVFHQSGQPGVRASWADGFGGYVEHNISVTQRLLEAVRDRGLGRFVFASSSSVYGDAERYPVLETDLPRPQSPYGVTKLAAEHLCGVYARTWEVPTVALRYFTVYGPRQRPDMAMHRLVESTIVGERFPMFGDGRQVRDFTFVEDVVDANVRAATEPVEPGTVLNVAGGGSTTLLEVIDIVGELVGRPVPLERSGWQPGDVGRTGGSIERAERLLRWHPGTSVRHGLERQVEWHLARRARRVAV